MTDLSARIDRLRDYFGEKLAEHGRKHDLDALKSRYGDTGDIEGFAFDVLGVKYLTPQQRAMLRLYVENRQAAVVSGQGIGKTFVDAIALLFHSYCRGSAQVVTLCPTERQNKLLWAQVAELWMRSDLPGELRVQGLIVNDATRHYAIGVVAANAGTLTGHHHERLLVLADECHALEEWAWSGIFALAVGSENKILATGNPSAPSGPWYRVHQSDGWARLRVSCLEHPNITSGKEVVAGGISPAWVRTMRAQFGENSPTYRQRVLAEWVDADDEGLARREQVQEANRLFESGALHDPSARLVVALDVARLGRDACVLGFRRGAVLEELVSWHGTTTTETADRVIEELRRRGIHPTGEPEVGYSALLGSRIATHTGPLVRVDEIGVGSGPLDILKTRGVRVEGFVGSRAPLGRSESYPYLNRRSEAFFHLRRGLEAGAIALPPDDELADELVSLKWRVTPQGKIALEPKEDLKSRLGRSPDKADCAAMCFYGFSVRSGQREAVRW